ncbi:glycosyltransferase [Vibrio ostreae]|uniref:Glycosyltransferase n=1 Tax=Vibrio ostreae TaxID=2841925 RepID=A0A975UA34_9VIBR|nr:glycosyltransferase [Vibrio ostreae]QXO17262.1 glycosyltransferase [Vibrio ostreae]
MNIKFLIRDLKIEGVQIVVIRLAKVLQHYGHEVEILTLFDDVKLPQTSGLKIRCLNIPHGTQGVDRIFPYFKAWFDENNDFDFLFAPHSESIKVISRIDDQRLIPYIHNSDEQSYNRRSLFKKLRYKHRIKKRLKNKHVVVVSNGIHAFTEKCCGKKILSNNVLYNPFCIQEIQALAQAPLQSELPDEFILFVGRLEKQKRIDRLLKAFSLLKNQTAKLLIMGEGVLYEDLRKLVDELQLNERVIFTAFECNPYPIMKAAKCLILTSDHEGFGNVLVESLATGTPALSVNCPSGPSEILTGELSQYLINSYDEGVIAQHLDSVLSQAPSCDLTEGYKKFDEAKVYQSFMETMTRISSHH